VGQVLSYPFVIGDTTFRLSGVLIAVLVLFFTHLTARLWRQALKGRILARSGMTHGARDSVATISVYLIWAVGILIALHVFGISTTSLMVAFGALGIGLGFGLQNIFNNFLSGLILLFERPIQVGDDIEINGIWAKVMQINVRATVVQTYDGAALIIPNSEFISNLVTNWSHRDPYLRRQINVGVAYGSDTELVRRTLLEAAANTAEVLTRPQPDVLFTDFGESTLDFRLRVWTTVNDMLRADTALRFEIDRLFRQRGIEIAFPQRDLHVRSLPAGLTPERSKPAPRQDGGPEAGDDD
jgi:small-conductance mechanosensitive channel